MTIIWGLNLSIFPHLKSYVHVQNRIWYIFKNHEYSTTIFCYSTFRQQIFQWSSSCIIYTENLYRMRNNRSIIWICSNFIVSKYMCHFTFFFNLFSKCACNPQHPIYLQKSRIRLKNKFLSLFFALNEPTSSSCNISTRSILFWSSAQNFLSLWWMEFVQ